jgi:uncharacterized membrane protein (DUF441 family)
VRKGYENEKNVALFRGVPVGPLIAAGLVSLFIGKT